MKFEFSAIGYVRSPFKDRFAVPRQHGLAHNAKGVVKLNPDPEIKIALRGLKEFTHIWVVFVFHVHGGRSWRPTVRPPRFSGGKKFGVLATRSPHRPNPIGISSMRLERIDLDADGGPELHVAGVDLVDQTPVLDIKPYIPAVDAIPEASNGWASEPIPRYPVSFTGEAEAQMAEFFAEEARREFRSMVTDILGLDPRGSSQKRKAPMRAEQTQGARYGFELSGYDIKYEIRDAGFVVYHISRMN